MSVVVAAAVLCLACGSKGGGRQGEAAGGCSELCCATDDGEEAVEVAYADVVPTTPQEDARAFMAEAGRIDRMIEQCEASGDDVMVPTIQESVIELDRRIVSCAYAYLERSVEEFETFCRLLDVDPDHMRRGFECFGLETGGAAE